MKNSTAIILILIAIGLYYTFTSPQYSEMKLVRAQANQYKEVLGGAEAIEESARRLEVLYAGVPRSEIERLGKVLPNNIDSVRLALDLDGLAGKYGISLKSVSVEKRQQENIGSFEFTDTSIPYEKALVSFSFVSSYSNFTNFLRDIERNVRIMNIREISFLSNDTNLYEYKMTVETYWLK